MSSTNTLRKAKLTVTISGDVVNKIDEIAKGKKPRSQVMEEILRDWLMKSKKERLKRILRHITYRLARQKRKKTGNGQLYPQKAQKDMG